MEAFHDATSVPGNARVTIAAELSDPAGRRMLARRTFTASVPVRSHDAAGAVQGFNAAFGAILDEIVSWVGSLYPQWDKGFCEDLLDRSEVGAGRRQIAACLHIRRK